MSLYYIKCLMLTKNNIYSRCIGCSFELFILMEKKSSKYKGYLVHIPDPTLQIKKNPILEKFLIFFQK